MNEYAITKPGIPFDVGGDSVDAQVNKSGMRDLPLAHAPPARSLQSLVS